MTECYLLKVEVVEFHLIYNNNRNSETQYQMPVGCCETMAQVVLHLNQLTIAYTEVQTKYLLARKIN